MPEIQTRVNNNVYEQITDLVTIRKQEGTEEASLSNVSSMLLELDLRVCMIQQEKGEGGFNQMEYNKLALENASRVHTMCTEILKMSVLNQESIASGSFDYGIIRPVIDKFAREQVSIFFPDGEDDQEWTWFHF